MTAMRPSARLVLPLLVLAGAAVGCGGQRAAAPPPASGDLALLRAGGERTLVVGAGGVRALPAGDVAPGGRRLFTATAAGSDTVVAALDVRTGRTLATRRLAGRWTLPATVAGGAPDAFAPGGGTLVLARSGAAASSFALLDAGLHSPARVVTLPGRFSYDASGPAKAGLLYLIEHHGGAQYSVRAYDLAADALRDGAIVDKREAGEPMQGLPTARATTADGSWVYTLYRRADDVPFVHALNASYGVAQCLDLPRATRSDPASAREWGLVLGPRPDTLLAANPALGMVVSLSTGARAPRVAHFPRGAIGATPRLALSPDGRALYVPSARGVLVLDTATLRVTRTLLAGHPVSSVVASGGRLYAQDGAVVTLDAATGRVLRRVPTSAPAGALATVARAGV
jgi:outer membrane protein assembly factor BamB